jgi:hypothetical protein
MPHLRSLYLYVSLAIVSLTGCGMRPGPRDRDAFVEQTVRDADSIAALADLDARKRMCGQQRGTWRATVDASPCADGNMTLAVDGAAHPLGCGGGKGLVYTGQCSYDADGDGVYFNDGPSSPEWVQGVSQQLGDALDQTRWNRLFWDAAVNHDYCYHGKSAYGWTKADCDDQFLTDLSAVCAQPAFTRIGWFSRQACERNAALYTAAVQLLGQASFDATDTLVAYPAWEPLGRAMGLEEDATQVEKDAIEALLSPTSILAAP